MSTRDLLEYSYFAALALVIGNLVLLSRKGASKQFSALSAFLAVTAVDLMVSIPLLFFRKYTGISLARAYPIYFYSHWAFAAIEIGLTITVIYSVFHQAMYPLPGLHRIGRLVFRWVTGVSVLFAFVIAIGPHFAASGDAITVAFISVLGRTQEGLSILIVCLLLFVCFATKPLGLTYGSRIFGVSLGLGVFATVQLVQAAWLTTTQARSLYSPVYVVSTLGACAAFLVWGTYFALPEPERKMILLPTTSPFFFWNRLSEALGDNPGHVALSGVKPSPVEIKIWETGRKSREREAQSLADSVQHGRQGEMAETTVAS